MSRSDNHAQCAFIYLVMAVLALMTCKGLDGVAEFIIYKLTEPSKFIMESYRYSSLRWNLAALLLGFPALGLMIFLAQRGLRNYAYDLDNPFRRWVLYGAMAVASIFIFYGLIHILQGFLEGNLLWQTLLLFGVLSDISSLAFIYFFLDVSRKTERLHGFQKIIIGLSVLLYIGASWTGLSYNISKKEQEKIWDQHMKEQKKKRGKGKTQSKKAKKSKTKS